MKRKRPDQLTRTAYHEAGHVVIAWRVGRAIKHVTVSPDGDSLGHAQYTAFPASFDPEVDESARTERTIATYVMCCLAGAEAESILIDRATSEGAQQDYASAVDMAGYACGSNEETALFIELQRIRASRRSSSTGTRLRPLRWHYWSTSAYLREWSGA